MSERNYDFQKMGIDFLASRRASIIGDDMGLGKSRQAILAAEQIQARKILVVTWPISKFVWRDQFLQWGNRESFIVEGSSSAMKKQWKKILSDSEIKIVVTHYENFRLNYDNIVKWNPDLLILDESHKLANRNTKLTKTFFRLNTKLNPRIFMLTGTPARNGAQDLWPLLHLCDRRVFSSYWKWIEKYFVINTINYGGKFPVRKIGGIKDPVEFQKHLEPYLLKREAKKVFPLLSEPTIFNVDLEMDNVQRKHYSKMLTQNYVELIEGNEIAAIIKISQLLRLRQIAVSHNLLLDTPTMEGNKLNWILEFMENEQGKVVFLTQFASVVDALKKEFLSRDILIGGFNFRTKQIERYEQVGKFHQERKMRAFVTTYKTGGVAIDLTPASKIILIDRPWVPDDVKQGIARVNRPPQTDPVMVYNLRSINTFDYYVEKTLAKKEIEIGKALNLDFGYLFVKEILEENKKDLGI